MTDLDLAKIKEAAEKAANLPDDAIIEVSVLRIREHFSISLELAEILKESIAALEAAEARNATAYAEGVEAAIRKTVDAATEQADMRDDVANDTNDWQIYDHAALKLTMLVSAIRALLKDKPNG